MFRIFMSWFQRKKSTYPLRNLAEHEALSTELIRLETTLNAEIKALYSLLNDQLQGSIKVEKMRATRAIKSEQELELKPNNPFDEIKKRNNLK